MTDNYPMKHICRNCHFLSKEHEGLRFSLTSDERKKAKAGLTDWIADHVSLNCWKGIWDEGISGRPEDRLHAMNSVDRRDDCFFFPFSPGMQFPAAAEREKREQNAPLPTESGTRGPVVMAIIGGLIVAAVGIFVFTPLKDALFGSDTENEANHSATSLGQQGGITANEVTINQNVTVAEAGPDELGSGPVGVPPYIDLEKAISDVTEYRDELTGISNMWNEKGYADSGFDATFLRIKYERFIRPYVEHLQLNDPGTAERPGQPVEYENPVDRMLKYPRFDDLHYAIDFLNTLIGRLQLKQAKANGNGTDE